MNGGKISITSLRNVGELSFEMPSPGVYLLTGENGAGKTTLLACMRRLGFPNAFPLHFQTSSVSESLDSFVNSRIVYETKGKSVEYMYRGERWTPRPRRNSEVLGDFGYPQVVYIGATADRITPRPDDFVPSRMKTPSASLIENANRVFGTERFNDLKIVNITRGVNETFVFKIPKTSPVRYFSERNFSLGELCVLKLLKSIESCPKKSLLLIDEIEMALHPAVQVRLFSLLEELAKPKDLTVIVSSHSVSLIKTVRRCMSIHLVRDGNRTIAVQGAFPSFILDRMADREERTFDSVIYVEDEVAERLVGSLVKVCLNDKFKNNFYARPSVLVTPIGGYDKVVMYLKRHRAMFRDGVKYFALLDGEVKEETIPSWVEQERWSQLKPFDDLKANIRYLPWVPEVQIAQLFSNHIDFVNGRIKEIFGNHAARIQPLANAKLQLEGSQLRSACKAWLNTERKNLESLSSKTEDAVLNHICDLFADVSFTFDCDGTKSLILPLV